MRLWQDELLWRIQAASNEETLFDMVRDEAKKLGFDHCAYGLQLPLSVTARRIVMLNSYPVVWQKRYMEENYLAIDPLVLHGSRSVMPIVWNEDLFSEARNFWEDAREHGLRFGWAQSCTNMQGIRGMLTLARCAEPLSEAELQKNGYRMVWLTQIVHQCMSTLIAANMLSDAVIQLSSREKDVLRWTADGKTAGEIASIINITERTVNFHIANAMGKLNCINKTAATVKAALLGLLY